MASDTEPCGAMRTGGLIARYAQVEVLVLLGDVRLRIGLSRGGSKIQLAVGEQDL